MPAQVTVEFTRKHLCFQPQFLSIPNNHVFLLPSYPHNHVFLFLYIVLSLMTFIHVPEPTTSVIFPRGLLYSPPPSTLNRLLALQF